MEPKIGMVEEDVLIDDKKWLKKITIIFDPGTKKGRGISQILDGVKRIIG